MPNIRSAAKRVRQTEKRELRNKRTKSLVKSSIRNFEEALQLGDEEEAKNRLYQAVRQIDKAAAKGILHKNNAARKKSSLSRRFNQKASG